MKKNTKFRLWVVCMVVAVVGSVLLKASPRRFNSYAPAPTDQKHWYATLFTFEVDSSSSLIANTRGMVRAEYNDLHGTILNGIDHCDNYGSMSAYESVTYEMMWNGSGYCTKTTTLEGMKKGASIRPSNTIGTLIKFKSDNMTSSQGGRVVLIIASAINTIGKNYYRKLSFDIAKNPATGQMSTYFQGSLFNHVIVQGNANLAGGSFKHLELKNGDKSVYSVDVKSLEKGEL